MAVINFRVERHLKREFNRACQLRGETMSDMLHRFVRSVIVEEKSRHPHLITRRTTTEQQVLSAIDDGAFQLREIVTETGLSREQVERDLSNLVAARILQAREQGGKTEVARGERKILYSRREE